MWRRETEVWSRLDHHNIVPFLGIATSEEFGAMPALVSAWMVNGNSGSSTSFLILTSGIGSVKTYLNSKTPDPTHTHAIVLGVAEGLTYLHSAKLSRITRVILKVFQFRTIDRTRGLESGGSAAMC
jgi:serine/threonine protein kinase